MCYSCIIIKFALYSRSRCPPEFNLNKMKEKLSILAELIKLAKADKKFRKEEFNFLLVISRLLDVDESQLELLFSKYIEFTPPPLEFDRILQFQRMVLLANVDLRLDLAEIKVLREAGLKLGLNSDAIENVLIEMKKYEYGIVPSEKLIEIFKVYHN